jgi:hypothetical protein
LSQQPNFHQQKLRVSPLTVRGCVLFLGERTVGQEAVCYQEAQMQGTVPFDITRMDATIPEGIDFVWNGCTINSGPLRVQLDDQARAEGDNRGELDYETNMARARFNVRIDFSSVAKLLASATDCELVEPVRAVLHSEGVITEDHNFGFSGPMEIHPHRVFSGEGVSAAILPGR